MSSKLNWTRQQEEYLIHIRQEIGNNCWSLIAQTLNQQFDGKRRTGKQCRERFLNFLQFSEGQLIQTQWGKEEKDKLFKIYLEIGPRWSIIAKELPGRSQNAIKNTFYSSLRKFVRNLNQFSKEKVRENLKPIKLQSLCRILQLEQVESKSSDQQKYNDLILDIKRDTIQLAQVEQIDLHRQRVKALGEKIRTLNSQFRMMLIKHYRLSSRKRNKRINEEIIKDRVHPQEVNFKAQKPEQDHEQGEKQAKNLEKNSEELIQPETKKQTSFPQLKKHPQINFSSIDKLKLGLYFRTEEMEKEFYEIINEVSHLSDFFYPF